MPQYYINFVVPVSSYRSLRMQIDWIRKVRLLLLLYLNIFTKQLSSIMILSRFETAIRDIFENEREEYLDESFLYLLKLCGE